MALKRMKRVVWRSFGVVLWEGILLVGLRVAMVAMSSLLSIEGLGCLGSSTLVLPFCFPALTLGN